MDSIDTLDSIAREMDAVTLLIGSSADSPCYGVADLAPGLHALMRRWTDAIDAVTASATGAATEVFAVELTSSEADALRARAAAHAVTPEAEILLLVDAAIQRQQLNGLKR